MERIDTSEKKQPPLSRARTRRDRRFVGRGRRFVGAVLSVGLLALGADAYARPAPIPEPVDEPEPEKSPGTGQEPPVDPEDPPPLPEPDGKDCIEEEEQDNCDPERPDKPPGNEPGPGWYKDMHQRMYELQESLDEVIEWASDEDDCDLRDVRDMAMWMKSVVQQYYALAYDEKGKPREYEFGKMTRGDFNFIFYYWVMPIYHGMLYYAGQYYERNKDDAEKMADYRKYLGQVVEDYHELVLCNYGFNGKDEKAREDLDAKEREARIGLR